MAVHTDTSSGAVAYFLSELTVALWSVRAEIFIFVAAFCAHALLFGKYSLRPRKKAPETSRAKHPAPRSPQESKKKMPVTAEDICRRGSGKPEGVVASLRNHLAEVAPKDIASALQTLLQSAGRAPQAEFLAAAASVGKERALPLNAPLGEMLLRGYYACHADHEFDILLAEIEAEAQSKGELLSNTVGVQAFKRALKKGDLKKSLQRLEELKMMWELGPENSPSAAPKALIQWLARLAVQQDKLPEMAEEVKKLGLFAAAFPHMLSECAQHGSPEALKATEALGRKEGLEFSDAAYCALLKKDADLVQAMALFKEAVVSGGASKELIAAATAIAHANNSTAFADDILKQLKVVGSAEAAGKLLQLYAKNDIHDTQVLELYSKYFGEADLSGDAATEYLLAKAFIRSNRHDLLKNMLTTTTDPRKRVALIKSLGAAKKLDDAFLVLRAFPDKGVCLYNAVIEACIDSKQPEAAKEVMQEAIQAGMADTVTYNTIIKAHLLLGNTVEAKKTVQMIKAAGLQPNCVTFNELLDACIRSKVGDVWPILAEMEACGIKPNHITGSILLKTIRSDTPAANIEHVLNVLDQAGEDMDEVLVSSVVEACIRAGRVDLLIPHLKRQSSSKRCQVQGAHTFGSIIRAYGYVKDVAGAWETWSEMRKRCIVPTAVTVGCMVEAVVSNGDPEAGYELIHDLLKDATCQPLVNAVIYCSVLKGFAHKRQWERLWEIYLEMQAQKLKFSIVTFNTLIDGCSRCGQMGYISDLLASMVAQDIEPNLITYSAILKGYCQENQLDEAFSLLDVCKDKFKPDEIMYNTLLDGCARQGLYDRGLTLLKEMEASGISPSNFTLSVLVKLCMRSKRLDNAFEIVDQLTKKYNFRANVHVYSNLVQACIQAKDLKRGLEVFETCLAQHIRPEARTYSLLLRAFVSNRQAQEAAGLIRAAVGLRGVHPRLMGYSANLLQPQGGLPANIIAEALEGIAGQCGEETLAVSLLKDLRTKTNVRLDPKIQMRLTTNAVGNTR